LPRRLRRSPTPAAITLSASDIPAFFAWLVAPSSFPAMSTCARQGDRPRARHSAFQEIQPGSRPISFLREHRVHKIAFGERVQPHPLTAACPLDRTLASETPVALHRTPDVVATSKFGTTPPNIGTLGRRGCEPNGRRRNLRQDDVTEAAEPVRQSNRACLAGRIGSLV
jgi:hypothetical protein